jgi:Ycf66 protein N-terminus
MLTYLLAAIVAIASLGLYALTFFLPAFKRERDLIWSGVGVFYALVLWICAEQVRGGLLLGQISSVAIIGWLGWEAFGARWGGLSDADREQAKGLTDFTTSIKSKVAAIDFSKADLSQVDLGKLGDQAKGLANKAKDSAQSIADKTKEVVGNSPVKSSAKNTETYIRKGFQDAAEVAGDVKETIVEQTSEAVEAVVDVVEEKE